MRSLSGLNDPEGLICEKLEKLPKDRRIWRLLSLLNNADCPSSVYTWRDDVDKTRKPGQKSLPVGNLVALDTRSSPALDSFLQKSHEEAAQDVEKAFQALFQQHPSTRNSLASAEMQVRVKDIPPGVSVVLEGKDEQAVRRLQALFIRAEGRQKRSLSDEGAQVDVSAFIEGHLAREARPCFYTDEAGRGFRALVLLDRSLSMEGARTQEAERACRILQRALSLPFVDFEVWGFQSHKEHVLDLTRFPRSGLHFSDATAKIGGATPIHWAVQSAARALFTGAAKKHIFLLTDGEPSVHNSRPESRFSKRSRLTQVREEVVRARRKGISVTGVILGQEASDLELHLMLGPHWKRLTSDTLASGLVQLVSHHFMQYLRNH